MVRKAASLLELVIAIVVMGIAVMALPLMLERVQENNAFSSQQEMILAARTQLGDVVTYRWDENSEQDNAIYVLDANGSDSELQREANTTRRVGHVRADKRRKFFNLTALTPATASLGREGTDYDDIDDFASTNSQIVDSGDNAGVLDYRFGDLNMSTTVDYISDTTDYSISTVNFIFDGDNTAANPTSLKRITVRISSADAQSSFRLQTFSANIGGTQLLRRDFP